MAKYHFPLSLLQHSAIISFQLQSAIPIFSSLRNPRPPPHSSTLSVLDGGIRQGEHFLILILCLRLETGKWLTYQSLPMPSAEIEV